MTDTDMMILIGILMAVLGYAFYKLAVRTKPKDRPGPHNNWRREDRKSEGSDFYESGTGM